MKISLLILAATYLGIGFGTFLKYYNKDMSFAVGVKILLLVPLEAALIFLLLSFGCIPVVFKACVKKLDLVTAWMKIYVFLRIVFTVFCASLKMMPVIAGSLSMYLLREKKIQHNIKKTKNDYSGVLIKQVSCQCT